jgi:hypothetical protein
MKSLLSYLHAARNVLTSKRIAESELPHGRLERLVDRHRQRAPMPSVYATPVVQTVEETEKSAKPLHDTRASLPSLHEEPQR